MTTEQHIRKRILGWMLIIFIIWDLGFSFYQHYHMPIGGDIAQIVIPVPDKGYYDVLQDPFGISVLKGEKSYPNPNRFFIHWMASNYLLHTPNILQHFVKPIDSIYLSFAIFKTLIQAVLILMLSYLISLKFKPTKLEYLTILALISALFQTSGYNRTIGIIDQSVIYAFFYAFPMVLFCLFLLPVVKWAINPNSYKPGWYWIVTMVLLSFPLALGGPLIPGMVLVAISLILLWSVLSYIKAPEKVVGFLKKNSYSLTAFGTTIGWLCLLCIYSLYLGSQNTLNNTADVSLVERYLQIPSGLWRLMTTKLGLIMLLIFTGINILLLKQLGVVKNAKTFKLFNWLLAFIVLYIALLPLGGYRDYRPFTVRYDTIIPVTMVLFFILGQSSLILLKELKFRHKILYSLLLISLITFYSIADTNVQEHFYCEYEALTEISNAEVDIVELNSNCPVMEFRIVHDPEHSILKAELLRKWNVTQERKLFYQKR